MNTEMFANFDDIRPVYDSEVQSTVEVLLTDASFKKVLEPHLTFLNWEQFSTVMRSCNSIKDFQLKVFYPVLNMLINSTTKGLEGYNWENISDNLSHLIISNHRDIVLDAGFLNMLLVKKGLDTTEIAIGDNLLIYPWITRIVRLNKSFIVKRGVSIRETLETSKHLSDYIHYSINEQGNSVWIAQREGRAKDSNDHTQTSLLKMLALHDSSKTIEMLRELRIIPLSLSYELDPCDYLKAKEYQLKRDNPHHKKTPADDLENMLTGISGNKGKVYFKFGKCINDELEKIDLSVKKGELLTAVADIIDREIFRNYSFFSFNYIAYDKMTNGSAFRNNYSDSDIETFENYLKGQVEKVNLENKDPEFLRMKIIEMYGNTLKNWLSVQ